MWWTNSKRFLFGLLYENNEPSLTRVIIALAFFVFILGTAADIILQVHGIQWTNYGTFAAITGGGSIAGKVGDKVVNTFTAQKYGSLDGRVMVKTKNPILKNE